MTNIAWKNLAGERTRFANLRGLYAGVIAEATRYVRNSGADLWVAQGGDAR